VPCIVPVRRRDIILHKNTHRTPWNRFANVLKKEMSVVGEGGSDWSADKTVTIKQCCIGSNCKIGTMAKLNNCVIMDNVTIGDKYVCLLFSFCFLAIYLSTVQDFCCCFYCDVYIFL
jgi:NDP-sugar pyrophosphorylase family protein